MATKNENTKISELDKKVELLAKDFSYQKEGVERVEETIKEVRGDVKVISETLSALVFVTPADIEDLEKRIEKNYVTKTEYQKLASKITPLLWFGGTAAGALVVAIVSALVAFVINGGLAR